MTAWVGLRVDTLHHVSPIPLQSRRATHHGGGLAYLPTLKVRVHWCGAGPLNWELGLRIEAVELVG